MFGLSQNASDLIAQTRFTTVAGAGESDDDVAILPTAGSSLGYEIICVQGACRMGKIDSIGGLRTLPGRQ